MYGAHWSTYYLFLRRYRTPYSNRLIVQLSSDELATQLAARKSLTCHAGTSVISCVPPTHCLRRKRWAKCKTKQKIDLALSPSRSSKAVSFSKHFGGQFSDVINTSLKQLQAHIECLAKYTKVVTVFSWYHFQVQWTVHILPHFLTTRASITGTKNDLTNRNFFGFSEILRFSAWMR